MCTTRQTTTFMKTSAQIRLPKSPAIPILVSRSQRQLSSFFPEMVSLNTNTPLLAQRLARPKRITRLLSRLANIKDNGQPRSGCLRSLLRPPGGGLTANSRPKRITRLACLDFDALFGAQDAGRFYEEDDNQDGERDGICVLGRDKALR